MLHLVSDVAKYNKAVEFGIPFFRTACGDIVAIGELTPDPRQTGCPQCGGVHGQLRDGDLPPPGSPSAGAAAISDDVYADLDAVDALMRGEEIPPPRAPEPPEASSENGSAQSTGGFSIEAIGTLLGPVISGFDVDYADWRRWSLAPDQDPAGVLGEEDDLDVRTVLDPAERVFLGRLVQLSEMIGIGDLASRVLAIVHGSAQQILDLERELSALTGGEPEEGDPEEEPDLSDPGTDDADESGEGAEDTEGASADGA